MEILFKIGIFLVLAVVGFWRGRRNERAHLIALAQEEERLRGVLVFSTRYPANVAERVDPILVSGSAVMGSDFYRMLIGTLRKVVGGNYLSYERLVDRGRRQALVALKQQAHARGARMVFNVMYSSTRLSDPRLGQLPQFEVMAYGTAIIAATGAVAASAAHHQARPLSELDGQTDLMKNKGSRPWVIGWFIGVFYAMAELLGDGWSTHNWRYAMGAPTAALLLLGALLTAFIAVRARSRHRLGWGETIILSLLTVPALAAVFYFAGLRVNAFTARAPISVDYTVVNGALIPPRGSQYPKIMLPEALAYWNAKEKSRTFEILLTRGWLPFWQYDVAPLRALARAWDEKQDRKRDEAAKKKPS
jgi:uncharacterized protein YbjQ (UPF0145 family)